MQTTIGHSVRPEATSPSDYVQNDHASTADGQEGDHADITPIAGSLFVKAEEISEQIGILSSLCLRLIRTCRGVETLSIVSLTQ